MTYTLRVSDLEADTTLEAFDRLADEWLSLDGDKWNFVDWAYEQCGGRWELTAAGEYLQFDTEEQASAFLLRWS